MGREEEEVARRHRPAQLRRRAAREGRCRLAAAAALPPPRERRGRRRSPATTVLLSPGVVSRSLGRTREREREDGKREKGERIWHEKQELWYIFGFSDSEEKREKHEKLTRSRRSCCRRKSASGDLDRQTRDRTARNICSDVDRASIAESNAFCGFTSRGARAISRTVGTNLRK
jgi:hypothetical protein